MRISGRRWELGASLALGLMLSAGALLADDAAVLHVKPEVNAGTVRLDLQATGPFEYTAFRASESLFVVDLSGVATPDTSGVRVVPSELDQELSSLDVSVRTQADRQDRSIA